MPRLNILIVGLSVALIGCSNTSQPELIQGQVIDGYIIHNSKYNYSFAMSQPVARNLVRADGSQIYTNNNNDLPTRTPNDYSIHVFYPMHDTGCRKSGISNYRDLTNLSGENVKWGRMDYYEKLSLTEERFYDEEEAPYCKTYLGGPSYAFCSNKNGKEIVMCIYQVTDNPELAKQIFESFRWTDGEEGATQGAQ